MRTIGVHEPTPQARIIPDHSVASCQGPVAAACARPLNLWLEAIVAIIVPTFITGPCELPYSLVEILRKLVPLSFSTCVCVRAWVRGTTCLQHIVGTHDEN